MDPKNKLPKFSGPADDKEEARWRAYQAWLRRTGANQPHVAGDLERGGSGTGDPGKTDAGERFKAEPLTAGSSARASTPREGILPPRSPRDSRPPSRAITLAVGGLALGLVLTASVLALGQKPETKPQPRAEAMLRVRTDDQRATGIKPAQPLPCFVGGHLLGNLPLNECARQNGVASGPLDVGIGPAGGSLPPPRQMATSAPPRLVAQAAAPTATSIAPAPVRLRPEPAPPPTPPVLARNQREPDPLVPEAVDPQASLRTVAAFYDALGSGDGRQAASMVVPEKRSSGPLSSSELERYYSALREPLRVVQIRPVGLTKVFVRYEFVSPAGEYCSGAADVDTTIRGDQTLVRRIRALNGC